MADSPAGFFEEFSMRSWLTGIAVGAVIGAGAFGFASQSWSEPTPAVDPRLETYRQLDLFAEILARAQADYVVEIDEGEAMEAAIDGMLNSLDPHSGYMAPDDFRSMQVQTSGEYGGLGIEVTMEDGFVKIVSPMDETPASRAGLKSGDLFTAINGKPIVGQTLSEAVKEMRGLIGTDITLSVLRAGEDPFDVTLTREKIQPRSVKAEIKDGGIGYLRISTFNERTTEMLDEGIAKIKSDISGKPKGIVIDLRNNGGGLLDQAITVTDKFMSGGEVVSTIGRRPVDIERYNAKRGEAFKDVPIIVLINQGSASAAEIVAGALQDRGRARLLGMTSFGKGSVQTVIPLGAERGAIRLTTARYYTPAGRSIQALGIVPDIEVSNERITEEELEKMRLFSEADLPNALDVEGEDKREGPHIPDEMPPQDYEGEDYQLQRALEILRGGSAMASTESNAG